MFNYGKTLACRSKFNICIISFISTSKEKTKIKKKKNPLEVDCYSLNKRVTKSETKDGMPLDFEGGN